MSTNNSGLLKPKGNDKELLEKTEPGDTADKQFHGQGKIWTNL